MNLGIGLSVATSYQSIPAVGLDPDAVIAALFGSGEEGAWYDPSDSSTVWQDAAGTTPAGVGDPVGRIDDKSGNGNHATQSTSAARPVLQQSGGLYYLDFDGVDDFMDSTFASAQAQPNTLGAAFKHDSIVGTRIVFDNVVSGQRHLLRSNSSSYYEMFGGVFLNGGTPTVSDRVAVAHFDSTSSSLRFEGAVAVSGSAGTLTWPSIRMGASTAPSFFLDGRIYSFVGVNRTLTAGEITDLETYLAAKSGVTL